MLLPWLDNHSSLPVFMTRVGNLAYFSNKQSSPSQLKPVELLDQIELDLIENSYNQMQKEMLQKKEKILDKIKKNLPRTDEEEEWLDNEGNPIDEKLFIDALLGMKDNDPIQATESHIKALHKIMKLSTTLMKYPSDKTNWKPQASVKRVNKTKFETVDKLLEEWTRNAIVAKLVISGDLLREKWKDFAAPRYSQHSMAEIEQRVA
ncbi:hypothetical protein PSTT_17155 [Puccinia striiformis]|uniref:Uncharacterized protein n=1 Tax=Puccinia striiformis TaxID=27350 RepID=A0A2S4U9A3_9BASI|nr:hypothetical protein PSTT_17155 [Puccinia striiformis]